MRKERVAKYLPGAVIAVLFVVAVLTFWNRDHPEDRAKVAETEALVAVAVDGVLHDLAATQGLEFSVGDQTFQICGQRWAPGGISVRVIANFEYGERVPGGPAMSAVEVFTRAGWHTDARAGAETFSATRRGLVLHYQRGAVLTAVQLRSPCVDINGGLAREFADRPLVDLDWK